MEKEWELNKPPEEDDDDDEEEEDEWASGDLITWSARRVCRLALLPAFANLCQFAFVTVCSPLHFLLDERTVRVGQQRSTNNYETSGEEKLMAGAADMKTQ